MQQAHRDGTRGQSGGRKLKALVLPDKLPDSQPEQLLGIMTFEGQGNLYQDKENTGGGTKSAAFLRDLQGLDPKTAEGILFDDAQSGVQGKSAKGKRVTKSVASAKLGAFLSPDGQRVAVLSLVTNVQGGNTVAFPGRKTNMPYEALIQSGWKPLASMKADSIQHKLALTYQLGTWEQIAKELFEKFENTSGQADTVQKGMGSEARASKPGQKKGKHDDGGEDYQREKEEVEDPDADLPGAKNNAEPAPTTLDDFSSTEGLEAGEKLAKQFNDTRARALLEAIRGSQSLQELTDRVRASGRAAEAMMVLLKPFAKKLGLGVEAGQTILQQQKLAVDSLLSTIYESLLEIEKTGVSFRDTVIQSLSGRPDIKAQQPVGSNIGGGKGAGPQEGVREGAEAAGNAGGKNKGANPGDVAAKLLALVGEDHPTEDLVELAKTIAEVVNDQNLTVDDQALLHQASYNDIEVLAEMVAEALNSDDAQATLTKMLGAIKKHQGAFDPSNSDIRHQGHSLGTVRQQLATLPKLAIPSGGLIPATSRLREMAYRAFAAIFGKKITASDGAVIEIRSANRKYASAFKFAEHLTQENKTGTFHPFKAEWIGMISNTLRNAQIRAVDPETGNKLYVARYDDGTPDGVNHIVIVEPSGNLLNYGVGSEASLVTQFPSNKKGERQGEFPVEWKKGTSVFQGARGPTRTGSTGLGPNPSGQSQDAISVLQGQERVKSAFKAAVENLRQAGVNVRLLEERLSGLVREYAGATRTIAMSLADMSNPTLDNLVTLFHEAAHDVFAGETQARQDAIINAITQASDEWLGTGDYVPVFDPQLSAEQRAAVGQEERVVESIARALVENGFNPAEANGIVQQLVRAIADLYQRVVLAVQESMGLTPSPKRARRYLENRVKMQLAGQRPIGITSFMGGPLLTTADRIGELNTALAIGRAIDSGVKFKGDENSQPESIPSSAEQAASEARLRAAADVVKGVHRAIQENPPSQVAAAVDRAYQAFSALSETGRLDDAFVSEEILKALGSGGDVAATPELAAAIKELRAAIPVASDSFTKNTKKLNPLDSGAESEVFADEKRGLVYKLLYNDGSGKVGGGFAGGSAPVFLPEFATRHDLNNHHGNSVLTEIVGITPSGRMLWFSTSSCRP